MKVDSGFLLGNGHILRYVKIRMATASHGGIRARFRNEHRHSNSHGCVLTKRNAHVGLLHILTR